MSTKEPLESEQCPQDPESDEEKLLMSAQQLGQVVGILNKLVSTIEHQLAELSLNSATQQKETKDKQIIKEPKQSITETIKRRVLH